MRISQIYINSTNKRPTESVGLFVLVCKNGGILPLPREGAGGVGKSLHFVCVKCGNFCFLPVFYPHKTVVYSPTLGRGLGVGKSLHFVCVKYGNFCFLPVFYPHKRWYTLPPSGGGGEVPALCLCEIWVFLPFTLPLSPYVLSQCTAGKPLNELSPFRWGRAVRSRGEFVRVQKERHALFLCEPPAGLFCFYWLLCILVPCLGD